jgi:hypothetical protein
MGERRMDGGEIFIEALNRRGVDYIITVASMATCRSAAGSRRERGWRAAWSASRSRWS